MRANIERYIVFYTVAGFAVGIVLGVKFSFSHLMIGGLELMVDTYQFIAPFVIYFILAPSLLKIFTQAQAGSVKFALGTIVWFSKVRIIACLFAIAMVSMIYGLPFFTGSGDDSISQIARSVQQLGRMMTESPYFYAIYAAILTAIAFRNIRGRLVERFIAIPEMVEAAGAALLLVVPLFMLLVGIYVSTLPGVLEEYFSGYSGVNFSHVSMFGMNIDTQTSSGIFMVYMALALLTGLVGTVWHLMLLLYTKWRIQKFSIGNYFKGYFPRIYGLLWATCSEALATPLNMYLMRRHYPEIETSVRQFTIGCGSVFFVNGTLICCFVMIPAVCMMLNLEVAVVHLLYCLPVIYILSFGIPGIPGELVLFAGPIMGMLAIPAELQPAFLLIFLGLQIGLPDSFRTATNLTEACLSALLLNRIYKRRYWSEAEPTSQVAGLIPLEATPSLKHGDQ